MFIRHFDMDILDLFVYFLPFFCLVKENSGFLITLHRRKGTVFLDVHRLYKSLRLSVLRNQCKSLVNLSGNRLDIQLFSFQEHLSGMFRMHSHQALKNFTSARAHQTIDSKDFTFVKIKIHMIHQISAAGFWKAEILDFQNFFCL